MVDLKRNGFYFLVLIGLSGCGVKGDPVAPGTPPDLGRGKPSYKRATEDMAFPDVPPLPNQPYDENDADRDTDNE